MARPDDHITQEDVYEECPLCGMYIPEHLWCEDTDQCSYYYEEQE